MREQPARGTQKCQPKGEAAGLCIFRTRGIFTGLAGAVWRGNYFYFGMMIKRIIPTVAVVATGQQTTAVDGVEEIITLPDHMTHTLTVD